MFLLTCIVIIALVLLAYQLDGMATRIVTRLDRIEKRLQCLEDDRGSRDHLIGRMQDDIANIEQELMPDGPDEEFASLRPLHEIQEQVGELNSTVEAFDIVFSEYGGGFDRIETSLKDLQSQVGRLANQRIDSKLNIITDNLYKLCLLYFKPDEEPCARIYIGTQPERLGPFGMNVAGAPHLSFTNAYWKVTVVIGLDASGLPTYYSSDPLNAHDVPELVYEEIEWLERHTTSDPTDLSTENKLKLNFFREWIATVEKIPERTK